MISLVLSVFFTALLTIMGARKLAPKVGLVDIPRGRKQHLGHVPLVGGLSLFVGLLTYFILDHDASFLNTRLFMCIIILLGTGVMDDFKDLSAKLRLFIQTGVAFIAFEAGVKITTLGELFPGTEVELSYFPSMFLTVFAIVGAINAFNMIDGINGLLGLLTSTFIISTYVLSLKFGDVGGQKFLLCFLFSAVPYILHNLGFFGSRRRVFMGDSGSMIIGFLVATYLIYYSQIANKNFYPSTVMWFFAVPLMDSVLTMTKRIIRRQSPFAPGRDHIHHVILDTGLGIEKTLFAVILVSVLMSLFGIYLNFFKLSHMSLSIFILCFIAYVLVVYNLKLLSVRFKKLRRKTQGALK